MTAKADSIDLSRVPEAVTQLELGRVIAYPTEAVWGLGADPFNQTAVEKILKLKSRPVEKGLILIASSMNQLLPLTADLTKEQSALLAESWPGPYTWLMEDPTDWVPKWIKGKHSKVAVRVTDHPLVQSLCNQFGGPIVSTSANPAGEVEARSSGEVAVYFEAQIDFILEGPLGEQQQPSIIQDLKTRERIR